MYFDTGHTSDEGNRIITENLFFVSKPVIINVQKIICDSFFIDTRV